MSESLDTFILRRLSEIASEESDLRAQLSALEDEQGRLRTAAEAVGIVIPDNVATALDEALSDPYPVPKRKVSERTIKDAVLEILKDSRRPMTALEILPVINDRLGAEYPRSSLSPQLSRLKAEGLIDRSGRNWSLARHDRQKDDAANGELQSAPLAASQEPPREGSDRLADVHSVGEAALRPVEPVPGGGT